MVPDWRDAAAYEALLNADRAAFAWEWLRRDPGYRAAALNAAADHRLPAARCCPEAWGLHAFEPPHRQAQRARPMWTHAACPFVLEAQAIDREPDGEGFDLLRLGRLIKVSGNERVEHVLVSDGLHSLRLDIFGGSVRRAPTALRFFLDGPRAIDCRLLTLRRLLVTLKAGGFSRELHGPEPRARRWLLMLRTADGLARGATQRELAEQLLAQGDLPSSWRDDSPTLRLQIQRLARDARAFAAGGYRALLH